MWIKPSGYMQIQFDPAIRIQWSIAGVCWIMEINALQASRFAVKCRWLSDRFEPKYLLCKETSRFKMSIFVFEGKIKSHWPFSIYPEEWVPTWSREEKCAKISTEGFNKEVLLQVSWVFIMKLDNSLTVKLWLSCQFSMKKQMDFLHGIMEGSFTKM